MKLPRARSVLRYYFGRSFFAELSRRDIDSLYESNQIISRVDSVKTREDLLEFVGKCYKEPMNLYENVPYRWYVVEDFERGKSVLIFVMQHGYMDGLSLIGCLNSLDKDAFTQPLLKLPKELSLVQQLFMVISKPYYMLVQAARVLTTPK